MLSRRMTCPICGHRAREFDPVGPRQRPNAGCPRCGSAERHRLLWMVLKERTPLFTAERTELLYFAPEQFLIDHLGLSSAVITTTDLSRPGVDVNADIQDLPFEDEQFDAVICNHVLEHVPDDRAAMRELRRVLKPGAWAIISVPLAWWIEQTDEDPSITDPALRLERFGQDDHVRIYGPDFKDRLEAAGFEVHNLEAKDLGIQGRRYGIPDGYYLPLCLAR